MASKSDQIKALREAKFDRRQSPVTLPSVVNTVNNNAQRSAKWRAANLDLNRQRAREGMRKLRAEKKVNG